MRTRTRLLGWTFVAALVPVLAACTSVSTNNADGGGQGPCSSCDPHATCEDMTCVCGEGYSGDGTTCEDVNECLNGNGGCDQHADCANTDGSRDCTCKTGFAGNGFTCQAIWVMVASTPGLDIDPESFGTKSAGVGNLLLFGPEANDAGGPFLRSFDTVQNVVSAPLALPPETQSDFCACGLTDVFLGAAGNLYMLGNHGDRYSPVANAWTTLPSYVDPFRRGEAAAAFDPQRNAIYLVGGRDNESSAIKMDLGMLGFSALPGTPPFPVNEGRAWVFSGDHLLYVTDGSSKQVASFDPGSATGSWTKLPDAPGSLAGAVGMGEFQGRLWVTTKGRMYFYRPATKMWDISVAAPQGMKTAAVAGGNTYALCKGTGGLEVYQLQAIE